MEEISNMTELKRIRKRIKRYTEGLVDIEKKLFGIRQDYSYNRDLWHTLFTLEQNTNTRTTLINELYLELDNLINSKLLKEGEK